MGGEEECAGVHRGIRDCRDTCSRLRDDASEKSSEIIANLMTAGRSVNALDVLIAGIAIVNGQKS